jgi:arylsulfatase A-like enzyme
MADIKNVLLIVVDQWRGDTLGHVGHPCIRTPAIDALCRDGVTFRNHYTQCAPCGPARASLLTGLYMMNHRVVQNGVPMDARHRSIADEARKAGYDPALVGYTTTSPDPRTTSPNDPRYRFRGATMAGWTPIAPMDPARRPYFNWLRQRGFDVPAKQDDVWLPAKGHETAGGATRAPSRVPKELSDTSWTIEHGLAYLRGVETQHWFLHLGFFRPHPPFIAPAPYNERYHPDEVPPPIRAATREQEAAQHPLLDHYIRTVKQRKFFRDGEGLASEMSEQEVRVMRAAYYGLMSEIDDAVGRLVAYLKDSGQYDNTLIVFTSDHAEQLGNHYLLGKIGYFDDTFHIPLIVRDPSREADATRGQIVSRFTETVDILPTILEWIGGERPRACDGRSLMPFLRGAPLADWRTEVHYEFDFRPYYDGAANPPPFELSIDQCSLAVVRDEKYKYVHFTALPPLFFDLDEDPGQFRNRANDPSLAPVMLDYAQRMLSWRLHHAERTLTGYSATPRGLISRR